MLYIAYGSNLHRQQMRQRCADSRPLGRIMLKNWQLVFRGVADIEEKQGAEVPCGIWEISAADERRLDTYEGYRPTGDGMYIKDRSIKLRWRGETRRALVYLMNSNGIHPPSKHYYDTIERGYQDFSLNPKYLRAALERSYSEKRSDQQTRERRARQLQDPQLRTLAPREETEIE